MDITVTSPCLLLSPCHPLPVSSPTISLPRLFFSRICRRIRFSRCSVELAGFQSRFVRDCRRPLSPKIITSPLLQRNSRCIKAPISLSPVLFRCASRHFNIIPPRRWSKSEKNETKPGKTALLKNDSSGVCTQFSAELGAFPRFGKHWDLFQYRITLNFFNKV